MIRRVDPAIAVALVIVVTAAFVASRGERSRAIAVPRDYSTIQGAIDAARAGDVIRVAAGDYGPIDFRGKDIAVLGDVGDERPRVQAVRLASGETWRARLEGFEIEEAAECIDASPTIERNHVKAGIVIRGSSARPTLIRNRITKCKVVGVTIEGASPTLLYNRIAMNGGGVVVRGGDTVFGGNEIVENRADFGGLALVGGTVTSTNDVYADNESTGDGGGVLVAGGTLRLTHATIARNRAGHRGGGVAGRGGRVVVERSVIAGNRAAEEPQTSGVEVRDSLVQNGDPGFIAIDRGDYRLRPTSGARDALEPGPTARDRDGDRRDARPDFGADEFAPRLYVAEHFDERRLVLTAPPGAEVFVFTDRAPHEVANWTQQTYLYVAQAEYARFAMPASGASTLPLAAREAEATRRIAFQAVVDGVLTNAVLLTWRAESGWTWTLPGAPGERLVGLGPGTGVHRAARPSR